MAFPSRGFDEGDPHARHGVMSAQTVLNWGTCRTEMNIILVAAIFLILGLGMLLYIETLGRGGVEGREILFALLPAMTLFLYLGVVMVIVTLFIGGAPTEAGASGWSLGTRVSLLAFFLSIEGYIFMLQTGAIRDESVLRLFFFVFAGELALAIVFWSLYQRAVATYVGSGGAGMTIPFMIVGLGTVGLFTYQYMESTGMIGGGRMMRDREDGQTMAMIATGAMVVLALFQAGVAGSIKSGITNYVVRNYPR
jgi:hypothetical protein